MSNFSFPKSSRLKTNAEFRRVLKTGCRAGDGLLVVYASKNSSETVRIGISIGKSCGGAVVRNRLKRLVREAFRLNSHAIAAGYDYVVLVPATWPKKVERGRTPKDAVKRLKLDAVTGSLLKLSAKVTKNVE